MTRSQIIQSKNWKFGIKEFVCPHIYQKFGDAAWQQFDVRLLEVMMWIRNHIGLPIIINTWGSNKEKGFRERGMRCNCCNEVKRYTEQNTAYLSAHVMGQAVDFHINDKMWDADAIRQWIVDHKADLPYPIRLERGTNWVHLDVRNETSEKIIWFDAKQIVT